MRWVAAIKRGHLLEQPSPVDARSATGRGCLIVGIGGKVAGFNSGCIVSQALLERGVIISQFTGEDKPRSHKQTKEAAGQARI